MSGKTTKKAAAEASDRGKVLENCLGDIERRFGKGSIMKLGESGTKIAVEAISTGILSLDVATGIWGVPRGRIIEISAQSPQVRQLSPCIL